jgi:hypothetical protein
MKTTMIFEVIVSTGNPPNFAPMGVIFDGKCITVRPYRTTRTYKNLRETNCGVVNVTDNVLIFAQSALSDVQFPYSRANVVDSHILEDVCRWYEFVVKDVSDVESRAECFCEIVHEGKRRDFFGFNRGKHAVIEATILATRQNLHENSFLKRELDKYSMIVEKTGGRQEREAMDFISNYVEAHT